MKTITSLLFGCLLPVFFLSGCEDVKTDLPGKWQVTKITTNINQRLMDANPETREMKEFMLSLSYQFFDDHDFLVKSSLTGDSGAGSWTFNPENDRLLLKRSDDPSGGQAYNVISFSAGRMVWGFNTGDMYLNITLDRD